MGRIAVGDRRRLGVGLELSWRANPKTGLTNQNRQNRSEPDGDCDDASAVAGYAFWSQPLLEFTLDLLAR
jgi:hypothetical protein